MGAILELVFYACFLWAVGMGCLALASIVINIIESIDWNGKKKGS